MPRHQLCGRSERVTDIATAASVSLLDFLAPATVQRPRKSCRNPDVEVIREADTSRRCRHAYERFFLSAVSTIGQRGPERASPACANSTVGREQDEHVSLASRNNIQSRVRREHRRPALSQQRAFSTIKHRRNTPDARTSTKQEDDGKQDDFRNLFDLKARKIRSQSHLPKGFFNDVFELQLKVNDLVTWPLHSTTNSDGRLKEADRDAHLETETTAANASSEVEGPCAAERAADGSDLETQIRLLRSVRELEHRLARAKADLDKAMHSHRPQGEASANTIKLSKEDYKGLVDLYYYSQRNRFSPDGDDYSPSLMFLNNCDLEISDPSEGFNLVTGEPRANSHSDEVADDEDGLYESPLKHIEKVLLRNQSREVVIMQAFVDLLLDDYSSNRDLFIAYKQFPYPGVAWLPRGIQRLFLQRMSTPWTRSRKSMLRYLSLIDDMQEAKQPITTAEWSSAIYLAGRSFATVETTQLDAAIVLWRRMEQEAGVRSTHVTFNILFDIAVRAGKFTLAESFLKEMYVRNLRLNRLGRVSMIFYHGLRGDGDAVRRTYRDFIDAGEIVDTLVLNCVIASLLRSQEPTAAEQTYERMKDLQKRLRTGKRADGSETFYLRYPDGSTGHINREMASNSLGRILVGASRLKTLLPEHHAELQSMMPLRPDHVTFRALISHHANVSGDLDRITVLLKEMVEEYDLPMRPVLFLLLFKGFALHGQASRKDARWNLQRLEMTWDACRDALKEAKMARDATAAAKEAAREAATESQGTEEPTLPKISELASFTSQATDPEIFPDLRQRQTTTWETFKKALTGPQDQSEPIERVHAELFDEDTKARDFSNPFFPTDEAPSFVTKQTYPLGKNVAVDHDEGEYILPPQSRTITHNLFEQDSDSHTSDSLYNDRKAKSTGPQHGSDHVADRADASTVDAIQPDGQYVDQNPDDYADYVAQLSFQANLPLVCWLLRAYTQCTGSRAKVEEIWGSVRKWYRPRDDLDRARAVRVLERCLQHCDRYGSWML